VLFVSCCSHTGLAAIIAKDEIGAEQYKLPWY
jgi:hypothetical protein